MNRERIRVMPLGDSITAGVEFFHGKSTKQNGGYRTHLWRRSQKHDLMIRFVGSECDGPPDIDRRHEGHDGWKTSRFLEQIARWLGEYNPQIVLLMTGTNDLIQDQDVAMTLQRLGSLIDKIFHEQPRTFLAVASIPPLQWSVSRGHLQSLVIAYNAGIVDLVRTYASYGKDIRFVNVHDALEETDLLGTHPAPSGYQKIAEMWYPVLENLVVIPEEASHQHTLDRSSRREQA